MIAENRLPGTTAWTIPPHPAKSIAGFANLNYAAVGATVSLYVSTTAPQFQVSAYRMGWYQGLGARQVWESSVVAVNIPGFHGGPLWALVAEWRVPAGPCGALDLEPLDIIERFYKMSVMITARGTWSTRTSSRRGGTRCPSMSKRP